MVLCTGAYQRPHRPAAAATLPANLLQIDVEDYRTPAAASWPGAGGRKRPVRDARSPRSSTSPAVRSSWPAVERRGRRAGLATTTCVWWFVETGFFDAPLSSLPNPAARLTANPQATGSGGGHDLHYRTLRKLGVTLLGHFLGAEGRHARFAPDLNDMRGLGDQRYAELIGRVRKLVAERGLPPPEVPEPEPFSANAPDRLDLSGFGAVDPSPLVSGPITKAWVCWPSAFDDLGFPIHEDGRQHSG